MADQDANCRGSITGLLWQLPTVFGRLVMLASAWNPETKRYHHAVTTRAFSEKTTHEVFRQLHWEVFQQWMQLNDGQRNRDLARYMDSGSMSESAMVDLWINSQMYKELLPCDASAVEREAFVRDLAILLLMMAARMA